MLVRNGGMRQTTCRFGRSEGTEEEALLQLQAALGYFALSNGKQQFSLSI